MRHLSLIILLLVRSAAMAQVPMSKPESGPMNSTELVSTDELIRQLSSDDWPTREQAQRSLIAKGDSVLDKLDKVSWKHADAETQTRALHIVEQIRLEKRIGASAVSLNVKDVPLDQVLKDLAEQSGGSFHLALGTGKMPGITLSADRQPYWQVMQSISEQARRGLQLTPQLRRDRWEGMTLSMDRGKDAESITQRMTTISGPLLIRADRIRRASSFDYRNLDAANHQGMANEFSLSLTCMVEPKLKVIDFSGTVKLIQVEDELGHNLIPDANAADQAIHYDSWGNSSGGHQGSWEIGTLLSHRPDIGKKVAIFKGSTSFDAVMEMARLECGATGAADRVQRVRGQRLLVQRIDADGMTLIAYRGSQSEGDWMRMRVKLANSEGRLVDDKGTVIAGSFGVAEVDQNGKSEDLLIRISFKSNEGRGKSKRNSPRLESLEGLKMIWEFPQEVRQITIPFEFRDLPVP